MFLLCLNLDFLRNYKILISTQQMINILFYLMFKYLYSLFYVLPV